MAAVRSFGELYALPSKNGIMAPARVRGAGVKMVNMKEIFAYERISDQRMELAPIPGKNPHSWLLEDGDLLFARQSLKVEGAGKCVLVVPADEPRTFESHLIRVRLDPSRADSEFYYYYFRSETGRANMSTIVEQVAAAGIRASDLSKLPVPVPPLAEQRAIAATLSALDDKIESNRRAITTAQQLMMAVYRAAPSRMMKASMLLSPVLGGTPKRAEPTFWDGNVKWASAKDVASQQHSWLVTETAEKVSEQGVRNSAAKVLPAGTIVMTARGTVGALARLGEAMAFNQSCYALVPADGVSEVVLFLALIEAVDRVRDAGHGTVFNTVNMATFNQIDVRWPVDGTLDIHYLDSIFASIRVKTAESQRLAALRDALLPELLSGRIHVPVDEAA